ncbi:MAG: hypothetical protein ACK4K0_04435 [Flavobacteriales bacterium]
MKKLLSLLALILLFAPTTHAQVEEDDDEIENYDDFGSADGKEVKRYCSPKIHGLAPAKLVSIGYDFQGPNSLSTGSFFNQPEDVTNIQSAHGFRFISSVPVVSHNKLLINVGATYIRTNYTIDEPPINPLSQSIKENGLNTMGLNTTIFKPLNETNFILAYFAGDLNGDYRLSDMQPLSNTKITGVALYGWRPHDRRQFGFGVTQTYRAGEVNYLPVMMYNYTAPNKKWGIEALLPARAHYRRTFNARNILLAGFELEGNAYRLNNKQGFFPTADTLSQTMAHYNPANLELKRSEIRVRLIYEKSLTNFIWLSVQAGYIVNYNYSIDSGDFYRGLFGEQPYVMENKLSSPLYFNFSINLVSP